MTHVPPLVLTNLKTSKNYADMTRDIVMFRPTPFQRYFTWDWEWLHEICNRSVVWKWQMTYSIFNKLDFQIEILSQKATSFLTKIKIQTRITGFNPWSKYTIYIIYPWFNPSKVYLYHFENPSDIDFVSSANKIFLPLIFDILHLTSLWQWDCTKRFLILLFYMDLTQNHTKGEHTLRSSLNLFKSNQPNLIPLINRPELLSLRHKLNNICC